MAQRLERRTADLDDRIPSSPAIVSKLGQFRSPHIACLSEETLKSLFLSTWCLCQGK